MAAAAQNSDGKSFRRLKSTSWPRPGRPKVKICEFMAVQNGRCGLEQRGEIVAQSQAVFFVLFLQGPIWGCGPPKVTQQGSGPAVLFHNCFRKRDGPKPWISEKK